MWALSNAFLDQASVRQLDRWESGPLELVYLDDVRDMAYQLGVADWNRRAEGGLLRSEGTFELLGSHLPWLQERGNPNLYLVPRCDGYTELHGMLASVLPPSDRASLGLPSPIKASLWLWPVEHAHASAACALRIEQAFERYIWQKLTRRRRLKRQLFSETSPLRVLAGDIGFWMHRIYRLAQARYESFPDVEQDEPTWRPIEELRSLLSSQVPPEELSRYSVGRPRVGGWLWYDEDPAECEAVVNEAIDGGGALESLEPVLEVLRGHHAHEDFSDRYSWVKEDFERSFYSKRSRVKVTLVETVDDMPVWSASEPEGYANVLFRDLLAACDPKERRIVLALRQGRTVTEIARDSGFKGHAAVSRRVAQLKKKLATLLL